MMIKNFAAKLAWIPTKINIIAMNATRVSANNLYKSVTSMTIRYSVAMNVWILAGNIANFRNITKVGHQKNLL